MKAQNKLWRATPNRESYLLNVRVKNMCKRASFLVRFPMGIFISSVTYSKSICRHPFQHFWTGHKQENLPAVYCCLINNKKCSILVIILLQSGMYSNISSRELNVNRMKKTVCYSLVKPNTAPYSPWQTYTNHSETKILIRCWQSTSL